MSPLIDLRKWVKSSRIASVVAILLGFEMVRTHAYPAAVVLFVLAGGIVLKRKWARFAMLFLLWSMVVLLPWVFNPFADAETLRGGHLPIPFAGKIVLVVVGEIVSLFLIHVLQQDKANFK